MITVKYVRGFIVHHAENLDKATDAVMDCLISLEDDGLHDSDMTTDLAAGTVEISITATADTFDDAVSRADSMIRSAIHAAGGATPERAAPVFDPQGSRAERVPA